MKKIYFLCFLIIFSIQANAYGAVNQNSMPKILQYRNYNMQKLLSKLHGKSKKNFENQLNQSQEELKQLQNQYR